MPLILHQLCCGLHPPDSTPTGRGLAVSCPLALSSALPIPGPGLSRRSPDASRILLSCPCSLGSDKFTCQAHTDLLVKALPPPSHLRSEACGEGHVSLWALGSQPAGSIGPRADSPSTHPEPRASHTQPAGSWRPCFSLPLTPSPTLTGRAPGWSASVPGARDTREARTLLGKSHY